MQDPKHVRSLCVHVVALVVVLATAACGSASNPSSPTSPPASTSPTLSAPAPDAPINDQQLNTLRPTLTVRNGASDQSGTRTYEFQVAGSDTFSSLTVAKPGVAEDASGKTSFTPEQDLQPNTRLYWRARMTQGSTNSDWSTAATFKTSSEGYILGTELYDPLMNGKTVGEIHGPVTFVPNVGVRLDSLSSHISYQLPQTLTEGEFSAIVTNMPASSQGDKTKLFAMGQGYDDIVTNARRMTVEKRGDPAGSIAWRFITRDDLVDTEGAERVAYNFQASLTYFWRATWRNNRFTLLINENGVNGHTVYDFGKSYGGVYDPAPHVVYIGAPVGRSGPGAASVPGVIIRQVWVSNRPRPTFANQ